jgi:hypothetical protein
MRFYNFSIRNTLFALTLLITLPNVNAQFGIDLNFNKLKTINSADEFAIMLYEKGWEKIKAENPSWEEFNDHYGYSYNSQNETAKAFAYYNGKGSNGLIKISFAGLIGGGANPEYEKVVSQIQSQCKLFKIDQDMPWYTCPGSKYFGKIGYGKVGDWYYIKTRHPNF